MDQFHALLFERILVPQLLIASRPFFAAAASGVLTGIVLDIGARGEGSEVSVVHESQVLEGATMRLPVDEGHLDDWLSYQLLLENPGLANTLAPGMGGGEQVRAGLLKVVQSLKTQEDAIGFSSPFLAATAASKRIVLPSDAADEGTFDVAKLVVDGKVDKIVGKKDKKKKTDDDEEDGDFVDVPHPFDSEADPIRIGLARHRYLEPLFLPHILAELAPSSNPTAQLLGLTQYEATPVLYSGVQDAMGIVAGQVEDAEVRKALWEGVMIISSGCVAGIRALAPALLPLLSPFFTETESIAEGQVAKVLRHAAVPEYFSEFKQKGGELGCYLGACIMAKILISDLQSRLFMSKVDYSIKGPSFYRLLEAL